MFIKVDSPMIPNTICCDSKSKSLQSYFLLSTKFSLECFQQSTYMKLLSVCLVSSDALELAKLMKEQYTAHQAHHFN